MDPGQLIASYAPRPVSALDVADKLSVMDERGGMTKLRDLQLRTGEAELAALPDKQAAENEKLKAEAFVKLRAYRDTLGEKRKKVFDGVSEGLTRMSEAGLQQPQGQLSTFLLRNLPRVGEMLAQTADPEGGDPQFNAVVDSLGSSLLKTHKELQALVQSGNAVGAEAKAREFMTDTVAFGRSGKDTAVGTRLAQGERRLAQTDARRESTEAHWREMSEIARERLGVWKERQQRLAEEGQGKPSSAKPPPQALDKAYRGNTAIIRLMGEVMKAVDENPGAFGPINKVPGAETVRQYSGTKAEVQARALVNKLLNTQLYEASGKAVTANEFLRMTKAEASAGDKADALKAKLQLALEAAMFTNDLLAESYPGFRSRPSNPSNAPASDSSEEIAELKRRIDERKKRLGM